ncbi:hypothetical protein GCM10010446_38120 [Streptomyces enissocaesilis]|uniref:Uncharacterized protein n=1 Tax=Streptomyces enissocaesilis TaxID=332589 RepID=A0ABP6JY23_9ACTN
MLSGSVPRRGGGEGHITRKGRRTVCRRPGNRRPDPYNQPVPSASSPARPVLLLCCGSLYTAVGSMGRAGVEPGDAKKPWSVPKKNDKVYVWGRRPGT